MPRLSPCLLALCSVAIITSATDLTARAELKAGAAIVDVTPPKFPVLVNGGMLSRSVSNVKTRLHARAVVLDGGGERIAIVVVDSCMMPRPLLDDAKQRASQRTKIRPDHMLISATHTHTAPASMSCLGTNADPAYVPYLREKLAEAIAAAESNLEPARIGWASVDAPEFTALRRWIRRPDRIANDPFGNPTVRANMHAGRNWDDVVGESGPEDPELAILSVQSAQGRPIAVLANYSMHYFGDQALSADYFGLFCTRLEESLGKQADPNRPFVAIMSHGCSGDIWRRDYKIPAEKRNDSQKIDEYADGLSEIALKALKDVRYDSAAEVAMAEARLQLNYRTPDKQRLEWAQRVVKEMGDRLPKNQPEVYAAEQLILHERQATEVVVQALRIGDVAIATTPNETYALTGLKIKHQSPLRKTMVIELANGGDGYIPPPEQHLIGGYNTWAARSAGLEVLAEPKITEAAVALLETVTNTDRRAYRQSLGPACEALLNAKPAAYWRLDEWAGPHAKDHSGHHRDAVFEDRVVYFLAGPASDRFCLDGERNRSPHFVEGRLRSRFPELKNDYTISLWFWNGMPLDARPVAGWIASRGNDFSLDARGDHLGVGGTTHPGKLIFQSGKGKSASMVAGKQAIKRWTWNHLVLVRQGDRVRVYLNGGDQPEIDVRSEPGHLAGLHSLFFGGRCDRDSSWEGRLDEIAVFDRALTPEAIAKLR